MAERSWSWGDRREHRSASFRTSAISPSGITVLEGLFVCVRHKGFRNPVCLLRCSRDGVNGISVRGGLSPSEAPIGAWGRSAQKEMAITYSVTFYAKVLVSAA